jgi:hypothetical protein
MMSNINNYALYASIALFIMSFKIVKYGLSFSQKLNDYMQIVVGIVDYMMFYLVLLISLLIAFSMLINYIYGNEISEFSSFTRTLIVIIGMILS